MCKRATVGGAVVAVLVSQAVVCQAAAQITPDWRHIGNAAIERGLAGLATGPVERVWYSQDGSQLYIRTASGKVWSTVDFESWKPAEQAANEPVSRFNPVRLPEPGARVRTQAAAVFRNLYA